MNLCNASIWDTCIITLHRHGNFGKVLLSDTCWTLISVRLARLRCSSGVFFFFSCFSNMALTWWTRQQWENKKIKNKNKIKKPMTDGLTNTVYPKTKKLKSLRSHYCESWNPQLNPPSASTRPSVPHRC